MAEQGLHVCLISVHGLLRGGALELGRDADCGGQLLYVLELANALAAHRGVARVDLVTRCVEDDAVDPCYREPVETLASGVKILRIDCGPAGYLPKEQLWDHLDTFTDNLLSLYRAEGLRPDAIHSHYADGGYVGSRVANMLEVPLVHTGHSLGRVKRRRLLASGVDAGEIESRYAMTRRVHAEEQTLAVASRVIASTHQEIEEQYELYDFYRPDAMTVIPPGTDLERFHPPGGNERNSSIAVAVRRFLEYPERPMILAIARADPRKNIATLVRAYGEHPTLSSRVNLILVLGNRDNIEDLQGGARRVLTDVLQLIDSYDLYGKVACPKHHEQDDVPVLYRLAALTGGVFVNAALTEPFGLTLLEAAASGLPVVATENGGPRDIHLNCRNGILVDPLDTEALGAALDRVTHDWETWQTWSRRGLSGVRKHYSWQAHAESVVSMMADVIDEASVPDPARVADPAVETGSASSVAPHSQDWRPVYFDRALFTDLNLSLIGDDEALKELLQVVRANRERLLFAISTGLRRRTALRLMHKHGIPEPDILVTSAGTRICYAPKLADDPHWRGHIAWQWTPEIVRRVLDDVPGLVRRERKYHSAFKISYKLAEQGGPSIGDIEARLRQAEQSVNVLFSHQRLVNVVPVRASKGHALRYVAGRFGLPLERVLAIGGSGADEDMMRGNTLAAVVGNRAHEELVGLEPGQNIYFASRPFAGGILEAIDRYRFLDV